MLLKIFFHSPLQKIPLSFPTMPSGNYRRFSLFQEWSACIKHGDTQGRYSGGQPGTASLSVISSAPAGAARPSSLLNIVPIILGSIPQMVTLRNPSLPPKLIQCAVSSNTDSGQGRVSILETVRVSMEIYQFHVL